MELRSAIRCVIILALLAVSAPAVAEPPLDERLGDDVVPTGQSVELTLDPRAETYSGRVRIELRVDRPTRRILFHARDMTFRSIELRAARAGDAIALQHTTTSAGLVRAEAARSLAPGAYTLDIAFTAPFNTRAAALYRQKTGDDWYCFTQFEATDARGAFPCWDEPRFKIPWDVTLDVPLADSVVGNTPVVAVNVRGERRVVRFARTRPLPSYLLAIAAGPLEFTAVPGPSTPTRVVTVRGASHLTREAIVTTPPLLAALERYFGRPYPYEKLDLLAVPEFWFGGMENAGAITFADHILLVDPLQVSTEARRRLGVVIAHELAHMWFGDLVTMRWWDDLWLNESFASWMGDKVTAECFPELGVAVDELRGRREALETDARLTTRAIRQPVEPGVNLLQAADELAYNKGQAMLGMFESYLGFETFRRGVLHYLAAHEWGSAVADDLWRALSAASGRDAGRIMATFLDQPGAPIVQATPNANGTLTLAQSRFLNYGLTAPSTQRWSVPVSIRYSVGGRVSTTSALLEGDSLTIPLPGAGPIDWVHPNADETGYYRWALPPESFARLAAHAAATMTIRERVGFLGNAAALLAAGRLDGATYARILERFGSDPAPEVVQGVCDGLGRLWFLFVTPETHPVFGRYVERTLRPAALRFGMMPRANEGDTTELLRPALWHALALYAADADLLARSDSLARAFLAGRGDVPASLLEAVLAGAAQQGDTALFRAMRERFETTPTPSERRHLLRALGAFTAPDAIEQALRLALSGSMRPNEIISIPLALQRRPENGDRVLRWMMDNDAALRARVPPVMTVFFPWFAAGCSAERMATVRAFFARKTDVVVGTEIEIEKVAAIVADCIGLREREARAVIEAFSSPAPLPAAEP